MSISKKKIYRLDDEISFRECTLSNNYSEIEVGDCTCFQLIDAINERFYCCKQHGIHFHCTKHVELELDWIDRGACLYLKCKKCNNEIRINDYDKLLQDCIKLLNVDKFKNAKLIRLDDWYVPELKRNIDLKETDYWMTSQVKTDKDGDTMVVLYVGNKNSKEKAQFFIKPEKLQLSNDYKDLDPAKVLAKIEVTLKDRNIKQTYDENNI